MALLPDQIIVGTSVKFRENSSGKRYGGNDSWLEKIGVIVEVGTGANEGRVRVKWSHSISSDGSKREDGKRTWFQSKRLTVV
jgi:hypothetical protein